MSEPIAYTMEGLKANPRLQNYGYRLYLRTPEFITRTLPIVARLRGICEICKTSEAVTMHHEDYSRLGAEEITDIQYVCSVCHNKRHSELRARGAVLPGMAAPQTLEKLLSVLNSPELNKGFHNAAKPARTTKVLMVETATLPALCKLNIAAPAVYMALMEKSARKNRTGFFVTRRYLRRRTGKSLPTIDRAMGALEIGLWITRTPNMSTRSYLYGMRVKLLVWPNLPEKITFSQHKRNRKAANMAGRRR